MKETYYHISSNYVIAPITVALITDLHGKTFQKITNSLHQNHPDIITIVGDLIHNDYDQYPFDFLKKCSSISPTIFTLGNHERKITNQQIDEIKKANVIVLDNEWVRVKNIVIGGMTSPFVTEWRETGKTILHYAVPKIEWLSEFEEQNGFKILLDHHPENYERITKNRNIDLILSGHAHGGQIRIFGRGLYAPHQGLFPKYTTGVYDNRLIVSRGLSNTKTIPRLWNPIELVYINISHLVNERGKRI